MDQSSSILKKRGISPPRRGVKKGKRKCKPIKEMDFDDNARGPKRLGEPESPIHLAKCERRSSRLKNKPRVNYDERESSDVYHTQDLIQYYRIQLNILKKRLQLLMA